MKPTINEKKYREMKRQSITTLFLFLFMLASCTNEDQTSAEKVNLAQPIATIDSAHVDAITCATSKPNQVSFNGTIVVPAQRQATIALTMGGIVRNTTLLPGQYVGRGTVLATLENPDFIDLQQTYLDSYAQTEYLQTEYERQKMLSSEQAVSQKRFQQSKADYLSMKSRVEATAAHLSLLGVNPTSLLQNGIQPLLQVKSPIDGYISNLAMNVGKYIQPGEALCEVIDKTGPMLCLTTYEKDLAKMKTNIAVEFRVNGMGETVFHATIVSIGQKVDQVSRSLEVYARINDVDQQFRPGMYVTARIK